MKNLESEEILSSELLNAITLIVQYIPNAVFGGSIALNAVGLINRKISDIDLFFALADSLTKNGLLSIVEEGVTSDTVTNTNGEFIQRTGAIIAGVKTCCFKVSDNELQHSKHTFCRNGKDITICIQNVNYAIEVKRSYADRNKKHSIDLEHINNTLESIL